MEIILSVLNGLGFDPVVFVSQLVLFYVMHSLLKPILYRPLEQARLEREALTSGRIEEAELLNNRALELKAHYEAELRATHKEAAGIVAAARKAAEEQRTQVLDSAREQAEKFVQEKQAEVAAEKQLAQVQLQATVPELGRLTALKLANSLLSGEHRERVAKQLKEAS